MKARKESPLSLHHRRQLTKVIPYASTAELPSYVQDQIAARRIDASNVLVLYYGGTIGMHQDAQGHLVPTNNVEKLLEPLKLKGLDRRVGVTWFQVYPEGAIDSTNARWVHWVTIGNAIRLLYDYFDGFVVIGGTDTMAHMMASLHFMFPNVGKPIIATGSQLPMFQLGDDATRNLYFALAVASSNVSGAHLAFADVLRHGLRIFKVKDRAFAAFDCPPRYVIGEFDGQFHRFDHAPARNTMINQRRLQFLPFFREGVKVVEISPATPSGSLLYDGRDPMAAALLVITFGAGNVRDLSLYRGELSHIDAIRKLREEGVPTVLGSPMMDGCVDSPYAAGALAVSEEVGAISAGDTCGPTLHVKAMHCLARAWDGQSDRVDQVEFRRLMQTNIVGELTVVLQKDV